MHICISSTWVQVSPVTVLKPSCTCIISRTQEQQKKIHHILRAMGASDMLRVLNLAHAQRAPFLRQRLVSRLPCTGYRSASVWAFQETPNPNVWKFQSGVTSVPRSTRTQLLEIPGVHDVLVHEGSSGTWLAITRQPGTHWQALAPQLQEVLENLPDNVDQEGENTSEPLDATDATEILEVLEHRIRPSVQEDGGDVQLKSWDKATGEVVLRLQGACRGCPQSAVTLQESILKTLQHFVPDVASVSCRLF